MIHLIEFQAMGCCISIQLENEADDVAVIRRMPEQVKAIEARLTRFNPDSELMRLNAQAGEWTQVSKVLLDTLLAAKQAALLTDGFYNPLVLPALVANGYDRSFEQINNVTVFPAVPVADWREITLRRDTQEVHIPAGSALDLGGIAKGWTAAYLAETLGGYGPCLVNIGGDMVGRGRPDGFPGWPVEVEDPFTGELFASYDLYNESIATSGRDYRHWQDNHGENHHHIIDPRTGRSAMTDALTVTVIHPHAPTAEAYTKAVFLRGASDGLEWLNQQWHSAGLVFRQDGAVLGTTNFARLLNERNTIS